jgi:uncharacterized PurR-regulated membrane protein YhhQ (DUF165 family)
VRAVGFVCLLCFIGTIFAANWAIEEYGPVGVGFGLTAPAGVYFAGLAFTFRDIVHRQLGRLWVIAAILAGGLATLLVSTDFARASTIAFLVSELADFAVYEPVRRRGWLPAVILSNAVAIVVDSVLFLWLAFDSLEFLKGQIVGKAWMTLAAIAVLAAIRIAARPRVELA